MDFYPLNTARSFQAEKTSWQMSGCTRTRNKLFICSLDNVMERLPSPRPCDRAMHKTTEISALTELTF